MNANISLTDVMYLVYHIQTVVKTGMFFSPHRDAVD